MEKGMVVGLIISVILFIIGISIWENWRLKRKIEEEWQQIPKKKNYDHPTSLHEVWLLYCAHQPVQKQIDGTTWRDLDMDFLFERLNGTKSSVGSEKLYRILHNVDENDEEKGTLASLLTYIKENDGTRAKLQFIFSKIGKRDGNFAYYYLKEPVKNKLQHSIRFQILGILPFFSLILYFATQHTLFLFVFLGSICFNMVYNMIVKNKIETELLSMNYVVNMMGLAKKLTKIDSIFQEELVNIYQTIKGINKYAVSFRYKSGSEVEMLFDYLNMMFMGQLISYNYVLKKLEIHQKEVTRLYEIIGLLDVAIAVVNFQATTPYTCQVAFADAPEINGKETYHPLLREPVANDVLWNEHTLVTGSNASGKSTYVKSVAINCILAQSITIACAKEWTMKRGMVYSAMAVADSIVEGDSYFVAEVKAVKRIIKQVPAHPFSYCFIDEILKGTNTIERIAASSSVIHWLTSQPCMTYVATHDSELTDILKDACAAIHFTESVTNEEGIMFDYTVQQGPATSRNALRLLRLMGYPETIVEEAKQSADYFDNHRTWSISQEEGKIVVET